MSETTVFEGGQVFHFVDTDADMEYDITLLNSSNGMVYLEGTRPDGEEHYLAVAAKVFAKWIGDKSLTPVIKES